MVSCEDIYAQVSFDIKTSELNWIANLVAWVLFQKFNGVSDICPKFTVQGLMNRETAIAF